MYVIRDIDIKASFGKILYYVFENVYITKFGIIFPFHIFFFIHLVTLLCSLVKYITLDFGEIEKYLVVTQWILYYSKFAKNVTYVEINEIFLFFKN